LSDCLTGDDHFHSSLASKSGAHIQLQVMFETPRFGEE
jgi:hypothetical protein